ncbi:family 43 glycosylhydrolase [Persicobacter psychrovividus]
MIRHIFLLLMGFLSFYLPANAQIHKQIVPYQGITDPHIRIFENRAYLFAGHDMSYNAEDYQMPNWWVWSSEDLVNWTKEFELYPEDTYMGPMKSCWATDAAERNGKYYWYLSKKNEEVAVVVADQPQGPYVDVLKQPLLPKGMTDCHQYDPGVFIDDDPGKSPYLLFGETYHGQYHIAKLNDDMVSLAEAPRKIELIGQYRIEDKGFIFKRLGRYYLIFGETYAVAEDIYGPYFIGGKFYGNHNSVFRWHQQDYVVTANNKCHGCIHPFMRGSSIYYLHFRGDGAVYIDENGGYGVGAYDANRPRLEAENYFMADGVRKVNGIENDFYLSPLKDGGYAIFPNMAHLEHKSMLRMFVASNSRAGNNQIEIRADSPSGKLLNTVSVPFSWNKMTEIECSLPPLKGVNGLCFVFRGASYPAITFDAFSFSPEGHDIKTPQAHWDFTNGLQGWQHDRKPLVWKSGAILFSKASGSEMVSPLNIRTDLNQANLLTLRIKNNGGRARAKVAFSTVVDTLGKKQLQHWDAGAHQYIDLSPNSDWTDYVIDFSAHPLWKGKLNQLKISFEPVKKGGIALSDVMLWKKEDYQLAPLYADFQY